MPVPEQEEGEFQPVRTGTAGIFTGTGWSSLHLVLPAGMGHSGHSGRYRNGINNRSIQIFFIRNIWSVSTKKYLSGYAKSAGLRGKASTSEDSRALRCERLDQSWTVDMQAKVRAPV
jgi:hypothetical protein